jgi:hypothetical protein
MAAVLGAGSAGVGQAGGAVLPRLGEYLDTGYIAALERTHSPWLAGREDTRLGWPQSLVVQPDGRGRLVALNYDWHAGRILVEIRPDGGLRRALAWARSPPFAVRVVDGEALCLAPVGAAVSSAAAHCYRYVGDAVRFVSRSVLQGGYVDRQGQGYVFGAGGAAHFPGYDFRYALVLDQTLDPYDLFRIEGEDGAARFMAFRRQGELLSLYRVAPPKGAGYGTPDFGRPLAVLRRSALRPVLASK